MKKTRTLSQGFTLIELLIVIAIIGLLATLAVVALNTAQRTTRDTQRVFDLTNMQTALEMYYDRNAEYPAVTAETTWTTLEEQLKAVSQFEQLPEPPHPDEEAYLYMVDGENDHQRYIVAAELEEQKNKALTKPEDVDVIFGSATAEAGVGTYQTPGWDRVTSQAGSAAIENVATLDCADPVYCRFRDAR